MIRSIHQLCCLCLGLLLSASVALFKEQWTWALLAVCVPWDKVFTYMDTVLTEWYEHRKQKQLEHVNKELYVRSGR